MTREDNKDAENVKKFIQAYQSEEVYQEANKVFNGGAVKGLVISRQCNIIKTGICPSSCHLCGQLLQYLTFDYH